MCHISLDPSTGSWTYLRDLFEYSGSPKDLYKRRLFAHLWSACVSSELSDLSSNKFALFTKLQISLSLPVSLSLSALSPNGKVKFNTADGRCRRVLSARHESDTSSATTDRKACFIRVQISIYGIHIYTSSADKTAGEDGNFSFLFQSERGICATLGHTDYLRSDGLLNWSKLIIHLNTLISVSLSAPLLYMHNEPPMTCTMN